MQPDVVRLAHMANAGDLVLFSAKANGRVVNFQNEMGSHGGMHIEEQAAFVMAPPQVDFDFAGAPNLRRLYDFFSSYHTR